MQFAILGSHPNLSLAEIKAVTGQEPVRHADKVALFENLETELSHLQEKLGGTQKMGFVVGSIEHGDTQSLIDLCVSTLHERGGDQKIKFGFSVYDIRNQKHAQTWREDIEKIGLTVKNQMKAEGRNARLVTSKEPTLSSVVVTKNKLLQSGAEFVLIAEKDVDLICVTESVQDFEDWSHRDYDRPARDAKRGMLPPKLARMMLNLAGANEETTVLDPFCGSGTVLMEAALLGAPKLIGNDIQKQAVDDTETNLGWLAKTDAKVPEYALYRQPAAELHESVQNESVDVVATEPFLGNPRKGNENAADLEATIHELEDLYQKSFEAIFQIMRPGGTLVIASPVHFLNSKEFAPKTSNILKQIGFSPDPASDVRLLYRQKQQFVARDILRFKKP